MTGKEEQKYQNENEKGGMWVIIMHIRETVRKVKDSHTSTDSQIQLKHNNLPKCKTANSDTKLKECLSDVMWLLTPWTHNSGYLWHEPGLLNILSLMGEGRMRLHHFMMYSR